MSSRLLEFQRSRRKVVVKAEGRVPNDRSVKTREDHRCAKKNISIQTNQSNILTLTRFYASGVKSSPYQTHTFFLIN